MATELWLALAAGLTLALGVICQGLGGLEAGRRWRKAAVGLRIAAVILLAAGCVTAALARGYWTPIDPRQAALGLAWTAVTAHLLLIWWLGANGAGFAADLFALVLSLVAVLVKPDAAPLFRMHRTAALYAQWALLLVGAGTAGVAGAFGLELVLHAVSTKWRRSRDLHWQIAAQASIRSATVLTWLTLGGGLVLGLWRTWRTAGSLLSDDPRAAWLAAAWLTAGASLLTWYLGRRASRWAAGLALLAGLVAVLSFLAVPELLR